MSGGPPPARGWSRSRTARTRTRRARGSPSRCRRSSDSRVLGLTRELAEALGRSRRVVGAVVVEHHAHVGDLLGKALDAAADLLQFLVGVDPTEALGHRLALDPTLGVAPMGPEVGKVIVGDGVERRQERDRLALRRVDADEHGTEVLEMSEGALAVLAAHPRPVAELDRNRMGRQALDELVELGELVLARLEGGRELEEEGRELARLVERCHRLERRVGQRRLDLRRELYPPASAGFGVVAQVLGQRVELARVAREQAVQLDVEGEVVGCLVDPALDRASGGNGVERRVDLDPVEMLGVPLQSLARREIVRIPVLYEPGVRPARRADDDAAAHALCATRKSAADSTNPITARAASPTRRLVAPAIPPTSTGPTRKPR